LDSGEVVLTYTLTVQGWLLSLATRLGLRSEETLSRKQQLDEMGSLTWSLLDGKRAVRDLVDFVCGSRHDWISAGSGEARAHRVSGSFRERG
jgi:hypothetical protein